MRKRKINKNKKCSETKLEICTSIILQDDNGSGSLATISGEGYLPTEADLKILDNIEKSLKNVSPYVQEGFVQLAVVRVKETAHEQRHHIPVH